MRPQLKDPVLCSFLTLQHDPPRLSSSPCGRTRHAGARHAGARFAGLGYPFEQFSPGVPGWQPSNGFFAWRSVTSPTAPSPSKSEGGLSLAGGGGGRFYPSAQREPK